MCQYVIFQLFFLSATHKNPNKLITPSQDLRQVSPHNPVLTLGRLVIFKGLSRPTSRADETNEKLMMEERNRV